MNEFDTPPAPAMTATRRQALRRHLVKEVSRPAPRPRRRLVLAPAVGLLATALIAGVVTPPGGSPQTVTVIRGEQSGATMFLGRAATAVAAEPEPAQGGYLYIRSRNAYAELGDGPARLQPVHEREIWIPMRERGDGLIRQPFFDNPLLGMIPERETLPDMTPNAETVDLPDDPQQLLAKLYRERAERGPGSSREGAAFTAIGDILRDSLASPRRSAALYRAAALIPGVEVVHGVTDAAGRRGTAIAHTEQSRRKEWIFDENTFAYLGERSYLVAETADGPAGTLLSTSAVLDRAVVIELGQRPAG